MEFEEFLDRIMDLDDNIRYATICDMDGNQILERKRNGVSFLLSQEETKDTLKHAVAAWKSRMKHSEKIGKGLYTLAVYERLRRITLPLRDEHLLLVTIDNQGGQKDIVDRILNQLYGDYTKY